MNAPQVLKLEITTRCNARCVFCSHDPHEKADMSLETIERILDAFPSTPEVQPQWYGEPLMHPEFDAIVRACKARGKRVVFYTNGSLLDYHMDMLLDVLRRGDRVIFSVEGRDKETYESLRVGLSWDRLRANIDDFHSRKPWGVRTIARITVCEEIADDIDAVEEFWLKRVDTVALACEKPTKRHVRGHYEAASCDRPSEHFTVKANGDVVLCCIDYGGAKVFGNVHDTAPAEIWRSTQDARNGEHEMCKRCAFQFVGGSG